MNVLSSVPNLIYLTLIITEWLNLKVNLLYHVIEYKALHRMISVSGYRCYAN